MPAAVVSIGMKRGSRSAAISAALYPPTVACDDSASIDCARVIRGMDSIANATTPWAASRSIPAWSVSGCRKPIRTAPVRSFPASSTVGFCTLTTTSASHALSATVAPASVYASSSNDAALPAPRSTSTS